MIFNDSYFEDEVRDGFFVPSEIKRAWAAELEVLSEIDKICKKHNIQYFADWGTLLAAVRHEGFIPWDDDFDIVMKRDDYKRFMEIAQTELPEGFSAYNFRNHDNLWLFLGRVVGKRRICFEEEHLERFHQFPYIAGVDIFVLDYVSRDKEAERKRDELALHTIALADMIGEGKVQADIREQEIYRLEKICGVQVDRTLSDVELKRELYGVVEVLFGWFGEEEADELTQLFPFGLKQDGYRISKKCYESAIELPYENTRIPVPLQYCQMLERKYGNYMRLVRDAGEHDYPFFETQRKQLRSVLDFEMPEYRFSIEQLQCERDENGYKMQLKKMAENLTISDALICDADAFSAQLLQMQQTAIEMGTLIEAVKGDGTDTVKLLEEFCEAVYECSVAFGEGQDVIKHLSGLQNEADEVLAVLQTEILTRLEVVFIVYKAEHLKYLEWYLKKEIAKCNIDVYVIVVPYYYKKYDGRCYALKYELDELKEAFGRRKDRNGEMVIDYEQFDIQLHHPDKIVIQNPYDEWNQAVTLQERYYSRNLRRYTDKLVYIPPFELEEFTKENFREWHNMQYYCTMPGVVMADKVYVQSENMRQVYIEKLVEFAGEETRQIWTEKIVARQNVPDEDRDFIEPMAKDERMKIAFYVQVGLIVQYGEEMLKKQEAVIKTFESAGDAAELVWIGDKNHEDFLKRYDERLAEKYNMVKKQFVEKGLGVCIDRGDVSTEEIVAMCDAYYGSESCIALEFHMEKKPVMIMDVEVI